MSYLSKHRGLFAALSGILLMLPTVIATQIALSDYFTSSPSFAADTYPEAASSYIVHDVRMRIEVSDFQWVLLGQERDCDWKVDNSKWYNAIVALQGASSRFRPLPKKQYEFYIKTFDGVQHNLVFRHSYRDPAYSREKLVHDISATAGGLTLAVTHVNLYINGEYNGLYQVSEGIDSKMLQTKLHPDVTFWYYVKRVFDIDILSPYGKVDNTRNREVLHLEEEDQRLPKFESLYAVSNESKPLHTVFNMSSLIAFHISRRLMQVQDTVEHNFYLAVDPVSQKLHPILWDADKSLGVAVVQGDSILQYASIGSLYILKRKITPSKAIVMYDGGMYDGMTEWDAYSDSASVMMSSGGNLSDEAINATVAILRDALADSAKRDGDKWSRWYCDERFDFDEAMDDMQKLLLKRRYNYYNVLNDIDEQQDDNYYHTYSCSDQWTGKGNIGMFSLLIALLVVNVLSILSPEFLFSIHKRASTFSPESASPHADTQTVAERLYPYRVQCWHRFMSYDYWLNVMVAVVLLVGYVVYAKYDVLDDSEILGKPYMADRKYIWIYFAALINVTFLVQNDKFRLVLWILLVLSSNFYSIIDLVEFAGAKSEEATVNSRGVSISMDSVDTPVVIFLFMVWRVGFQVIMMLYSFRIPEIARHITMKLDVVTEKGEIFVPTTIAVKEEGLEMGCMLDVAPAEDSYTLCDTMDTVDNGHVESTDISIEEKCADTTSERELKISVDKGVACEVDLTFVPPPTDSPPKNKKYLTGQALMDYKRRMKLFMRLNMGVFIGICVGYVIYMAVDGTLKRTIGEIAFSAIISVAILINIRAFFSCAKWFWLHAYGFTTPTLDLMFSNREDESKWSLETLKSMKIKPQTGLFSFLLPGTHMTTEKKIRTVDAWTKKISHTYDGLLVFIISSESFAEGENTSETYSLAYGISLIYMILYVLSYGDNGSLAWIIYGAKARIMDGFLGRENEIFGYMFDKYMLPASVPLLLWLQDAAGDTRVVYLSWYIFMPIIIGDSFAEIIGSTWGKQKIKVWGMGEVNTKSWEGTLAMFFSSLVILLVVNAYVGLPWPWYIFAIINCAVATAVELYAYRSTDNVCMMVFSSLLAIAFINIIDG